MTDRDDDREAIEIWLAAFQDTQRQMAEAHSAYQAAMAEGHRAFIDAIRESQRRLADVLDGRVEPGKLAAHLRESGIVEVDESHIESIRETVDLPTSDLEVCKRFVASVVPRESPGERLLRLGENEIVVVPDQMGVADALVRLMRGEGFRCELAAPDEVPEGARAVLHLAAIQDFDATDGALAAIRDAARLVDRLDLNEGLFVAAFDTGGRFGIDACEPARAPTAGMSALVKSLAARFANASLKWIDLDVGYRDPESVARDLLRELLEGGNQNVGLPEGERVVRILEETDARATSWRFDGVMLMSVSDSPSVLSAISCIGQIGSPRVVFVGGPEHREAVERMARDVEHRWISFDADHLMGVFDALDQVRSEWGPVGALVHANAGTEVPFSEVESVLARRLITLQVLQAATAGDPVSRFATLSSFDSADAEALADEMLRKVALAERDRRGSECVVKAITVDSTEAAAKGFWDEWSRDSEQVEVYLQCWSG